MSELAANLEREKSHSRLYNEFVSLIAPELAEQFLLLLPKQDFNLNSELQEKLDKLLKYLGAATFDTGLCESEDVGVARFEGDRIPVYFQTPGVYIQGSALMMEELRNEKVLELQCYPHNQQECQNVKEFVIIKVDVKKLKFMNEAKFGEFGLKYICGRINEVFTKFKETKENKDLELCILNRLGGDEFCITLKFGDKTNSQEKSEIIEALKKDLEEINNIPVKVIIDPNIPPTIDFSGVSIDIVKEPNLMLLQKLLLDDQNGAKLKFLRQLLNSFEDKDAFLEKVFCDSKIIYDYGIIAGGQIQELDKILHILDTNYSQYLASNTQLNDIFNLDIRKDFLKTEHERVEKIKTETKIEDCDYNDISQKINNITSRFTFLKTPFEDALAIDNSLTQSGVINSYYWTKMLLKKVLQDTTDYITGEFTLNRNSFAKLLNLGYFDKVCGFEIKPKGVNNISYFMGNDMITALKSDLYSHIFGQEFTDIPGDLQPYLHLAKVGPTIFLAQTQSIPKQLRVKVSEIFEKAETFNGFKMENGGKIIDFPTASNLQVVGKNCNPGDFIEKLLDEASNGWYTNTIKWFSAEKQNEFLVELNKKFKDPGAITTNPNVEHWIEFFTCSRKKMYFEGFKKTCQSMNIQNDEIQRLLKSLENSNLDESTDILTENSPQQATESKMIEYYINQAQSGSKLISKYSRVRIYSNNQEHCLVKLLATNSHFRNNLVRTKTHKSIRFKRSSREPVAV